MYGRHFCVTPAGFRTTSIQITTDGLVTRVTPGMPEAAAAESVRPHVGASLSLLTQGRRCTGMDDTTDWLSNWSLERADVARVLW